MIMKNSKLNICNTIINPGEIANLALPLPEEYSCNPLFMPIRVIHGNQKGPCLIIFSILKGDELNGLEIANQIVDSLNPNDIKGTLIAIPVLNVYGLTRYPSSLPTKDLNLVDCFPDLKQAPMASVLLIYSLIKFLKRETIVLSFRLEQ